MKREQADRICDHLIDAFEAMGKADMAIAGLGKEERHRFDHLLHEVVRDLEDKLLLPICEQYPDLLPPEEEWERPEICSELTWSEVKLPSFVTENQLDEMIFSLLKPQWRKTAMFLIYAEKRCKELGWLIGDEAIAARLQVLSDSNRIEGIGDLRIWRGSEVRLKD
ncbi:hypothetical protein UP10_07520 [Bradyrhizobium sp. LTSPM299]|uniref:hypothetical protein n=1 Tax=Bradyrhizobium sp. LTSPM299 TaxID=1619233 RepID=UPI0005C939EB|nr:hypothetical protein [Bradyrhizobium sp. LTSPM299]KJC61390.1 hypothetical protein UP10_07520 [Bradyrhizobium sp. LTSPM299]